MGLADKLLAKEFILDSGEWNAVVSHTRVFSAFGYDKESKTVRQDFEEEKEHERNLAAYASRNKEVIKKWWRNLA